MSLEKFKEAKKPITAWAIIDCEWNTIRQIERFRHRLAVPDCRKCWVGKVEIRKVKQ